MNKFSERAKVAVSVTPTADIDTSDVSTASGMWQSIANYDRITGIAIAEGPGAGKILTIQLRQALNASGGSAKNLGTAVTSTAVANEALRAIQDARAEDFDVAGGFTFVGMTIGTDKTTAVDGGGLVILDEGRFSE